jgi:chitinase
MNTPIIRPLFFVFITILFCASCKTRTVHYGPDIYQPDTSFKVVGYLASGNFDHIDELELDKLTYLNLAFGNPDKDGNLIFDGNADIIPIVNKAHDANLKVFISLAGGGRPDTVIWKSLLKRKNRSSFIKNILDYVERNNLDGVDVDIEWNLFPTVGETYNAFVIELRNALHAKGQGISSALGATNLPDIINQEALNTYDFINVMVYDKTGIWNPDEIGPHSPYSYAGEAIKYWTEDKNIPADRIMLGVPFYGFDFTPPARYINYEEIIRGNPLNAYTDSVGMIYYNGIPTIVQKTELAKKQLGGIMIWELACDTTGDMSLLRALYQTLKAGDCAVTSFYKDEDRDGFGNPSKPVQSCDAPDGYVTNREDADDTNPKIRRK